METPRGGGRMHDQSHHKTGSAFKTVAQTNALESAETLRAYVRLRPTRSQLSQWTVTGPQTLALNYHEEEEEHCISTNNNNNNSMEGYGEQAGVPKRLRSKIDKIRERVARAGFARVFSPNDNNATVFRELCPETARRVTLGFNETVLMYGQTGSGKTHTFFGSGKRLACDGLLPSLLRAIKKESLDAQKRYGASVSIEVSCFEIYNERMRDLFEPGNDINPYTMLQEKRGLNKRTDKRGLPFRHQMFAFAKSKQARKHESVATSSSKASAAAHSMSSSGEEDLDLSIFRTAFKSRTATDNIGEGELKHRSSRSHLVLQVYVTSSRGTFGTLTLVDLAGSEKLTDAVDTKSQREGNNIRKSLSALTNMLMFMSEQQSDQEGGSSRKEHQNNKNKGDCRKSGTASDRRKSGGSGMVTAASATTAGIAATFRDSRLTMVLDGLIGGNTRTCVVFCINPAPKHVGQSIHTLTLAIHAMKIRARPVQVTIASKTTLTRHNSSLAKLNAGLKMRNLRLEAALVDMRRRLARHLGHQNGEGDVNDRTGRDKGHHVYETPKQRAREAATIAALRSEVGRLAAEREENRTKADAIAKLTSRNREMMSMMDNVRRENERLSNHVAKLALEKEVLSRERLAEGAQAQERYDRLSRAHSQMQTRVEALAREKALLLRTIGEHEQREQKQQLKVEEVRDGDMMNRSGVAGSVEAEVVQLAVAPMSPLRRRAAPVAFSEANSSQQHAETVSMNEPTEDILSQSMRLLKSFLSLELLDFQPVVRSLRSALEREPSCAARIAAQLNGVSCGSQGRTILMHAAQHGNDEMVTELVGLGADVHCREDETGRTPFLIAARAGNSGTAGRLIDLGANVNDRSNCSSTALMLAARYGHLDVIRLLVSTYLIHIEEEDDRGWTALHFAAAYGHADICDFLVRCGANRASRDMSGKCAADYGAIYGHTKVLKVLQQSALDCGTANSQSVHPDGSVGASSGSEQDGGNDSDDSDSTFYDDIDEAGDQRGNYSSTPDEDDDGSSGGSFQGEDVDDFPFPRPARHSTGSTGSSTGVRISNVADDAQARVDAAFRRRLPQAFSVVLPSDKENAAVNALDALVANAVYGSGSGPPTSSNLPPPSSRHSLPSSRRRHHHKKSSDKHGTGKSESALVVELLKAKGRTLTVHLRGGGRVTGALFQIDPARRTILLSIGSPSAPRFQEVALPMPISPHQ